MLHFDCSMAVGVWCGDVVRGCLLGFLTGSLACGLVWYEQVCTLWHEQLRWQRSSNGLPISELPGLQHGGDRGHRRGSAGPEPGPGPGSYELITSLIIVTAAAAGANKLLGRQSGVQLGL